MFRVRKWSARHAGGLATIYRCFEKAMVSANPLLAKIGYQALEKPVAVVERAIKGFLFDTKMCGSCTLGSTGMTCPMNCPKKLRNGPCGGVRQNGMCEIDSTMTCVWLDAYSGSQKIEHGVRILEIQQPVDHRLQGTSSWLREVRKKVGLE